MNLKTALTLLCISILLVQGISISAVIFTSKTDPTKTSLFATQVFDEEPVFQKGFSYSAWSSDAFGTAESDESLRLLTQTNTEWIALCFSWVQSNMTSSDIHLNPTGSPTTASVQHAIATAHSLGLKVMLKPMVEPLEREEDLAYPVWRGEIQPSNEWFTSYSNFLNDFAEFAQQNNVEVFCVGCEYKETTGWSEQWHSVIQGVRDRYSGPITYAADWSNYQQIGWWDAVDYVGIDAYFPLSIFDTDPSLEDLNKVWNNYADDMEEWIETVNKPVILTEIGYRSGDGTNMAPSNYWSDMEVDLQEQQDCYEAAFNALWNRSWFYGFYWWTWIHDPDKGGVNDSFHTPQNKPTQSLVTQWYSLDRQVAVVDNAVTSSQWCNINEEQQVSFHVKWEHNGADVAGAKVFVNGTEYTTNSSGWATFNVNYDSSDKRSWIVTDVEHPQATRYSVAATTPSIVWDELEFSVEIESMFFASKVTVTLVQASDGTVVSGATTLVNGKLCEETQQGVYTAEISSFSPFEQIVVQTQTTDMLTQNWSWSGLQITNLAAYLAVLGVAALLFFVFLKRKHNSSDEQQKG